METTFISIHSLDDDARILYTSDSIIDILGYTPDEVVNRSAWEFFAEEELPYARKFHQKKVSQDKAAVLAYCRVKDKDGRWVGCECCFTMVYDVMIVCTSIYNRGMKSQTRALEAPIVRRIFTASPQDPRYHMLSHMSAKFAQPAKAQLHEPRAALFLNRFTRTLTVMYATSGVQDILGISSENMRGRSFYYCIAENCLPEAIKCLENAKGNDSVAYLRFWFRDPRQDDPPEPEYDSDEEMTDGQVTSSTSVDNSEGGVGVQRGRQVSREISQDHENAILDDGHAAMDIDDEGKTESRTSSGDSTQDTHEAIFGDALAAESSASSQAPSPEGERRETGPVELEAVISCASDGLVVCLRKARPMIPHPTHRPSKPVYANGLFAAPWARDPMIPPIESRPNAGFGSTFAPSLGPHGAQHNNISPVQSSNGLDQSDFMNAIRDQAVFAWGLTGINGSLAQFGKNKPYGEAMPQDGLPIWASDPSQSTGSDRGMSGSRNGTNSSGNSSRSPEDGQPRAFGYPGLDGNGSNGTGHMGNGNGYGNNGIGHTTNGNGMHQRDAYFPPR